MASLATLEIRVQSPVQATVLALVFYYALLTIFVSKQILIVRTVNEMIIKI